MSPTPLSKLLVVDDDAVVLETLAAVLEDYDLTLASSLKQATIAFEAKDFDLVVTDYQLGDGTGEELVKTLRARRGADASAIVLTGHTDFSEVRELQARGELLVLFKPVDPRELLSWVRNELTMARLRRSLRKLES